MNKIDPPDWATNLRNAAEKVKLLLDTEAKFQAMQVAHQELKDAIKAWDDAVKVPEAGNAVSDPAATSGDGDSGARI